MNDRQWRDKLQRHFADHERSEPEGLWEGIERELVAKRHSAAPSVRRRMFYWSSRIGAAAAMIALTLWLGRIAFETSVPKTGTDTTVTIAGKPPQPETITPLHHQPVAVEPVKPYKSAPSARPERIVPGIVASSTGSPSGIAERKPMPASDSIEGESRAEFSARKSDLAPSPAGEDRPARQDQSSPVTAYGNGDVLALNVPDRRNGSGLSARIVASGIPGSGSTVSRGFGTLSSANPLPQSDFHPLYDAKFGENAITDIMLLNRDSRTYTETRHSPPVRAGIVLDYGLGDRLSIESGLVYTYLGAKLKSGSERYYYRTRQSLHYLGIPLNLNYSLWQNDRMAVYVSGGGMAERNISGNASTEYTDGENTFARENRRLKVDRTQWSANASVGFQVNLSRRTGIFVDPGISYYFDNGSSVETAYTKNPLNFDLTLGLRISLD